MSATDGKTSPASDFAAPETKLFDLPRPGAGGKVLTVQIRTVPPIDLITAMEGVPELNQAAVPDLSGTATPEKSFEAMRQTLLEQEAPQRKIVALAVLDPVFTFETPPEAGKAPWRNLHSDNQLALIAEIMDFSGFSKKPAAPGPAAAPATPAEAATASAESFRGVAPE
jgi:hypothetical protein